VLTRVNEYLKRVDRHLATLDGASARRRFLNNQIDRFERLYADFITDNDDSDEPIDPSTTDPPDAFDYLIALIELAARME
jgi:hypothetical protein